jgi:predicted acyltransferase
LLTTGLDLLIISALIFIVEIENWNKLNWTNFFVVFGKNPLFIYILSEILLISMIMIRTGPTARTNLYTDANTYFFQKIAPGSLGAFLYAICYMLLCWSVGWILAKKKIYIRV